jgi:lactate permease
MVVLVAGWRGLRGALPAALVCGVSFAAVQRLSSRFLGPELTDILASLAAIVTLVGLLRVWQPRDGAPHPGPLPAGRGEGKRAVWHAAVPYMLLAGCVLLWGLPPVKAALRATSVVVRWPGLHGLVARVPPVVPAPAPYAAEYRFDWLASAGTACLVATLLAAALARVPPRAFAAVVARTTRQLALPLLTIASVLALAFVMNYSGATATLGLAFAETGKLFPFFSALLGWMGVFLTGSDASSNALFGNLQVITAGRLGLDPVLTASANSSGGVLGKMISVQSIAVAAAASGMAPADEARLFRFTFWHSLILVCGMGALTTLYAYAISGFGR